MDDDDTRNAAKTTALFDARFPGVLARLDRLPGERRPAYPYRRIRPGRRNQYTQLQLWIAYFVRARGGVYVRMRVVLEEQQPNEWKNVIHCYHFGTRPVADDDEDGDGTLFRVCHNGRWPYHFHLRGYEKAYDAGHIPAAKAEPPLDADPGQFVGLLEHFVQHNDIPMKVKP